MQSCPNCEGKKYFKYDPNPYWLEDEEYRKPVELQPCNTCNGVGEVTDLFYNIWIVNGKPLRPIRHGF